jgi:glutamate dehydrogenase
MVNRMGPSFVFRQRKATGAQVADVARAYTSVMEIYSLGELWKSIEALDNRVDSAVQMEMMFHLMRLVKRATRWLLRNRRRDLAPSHLILEFKGGLEALREAFPSMLRGRAAEQHQRLHDRYIGHGIDPELAKQVASTHHAYTALGIIQAAAQAGAPLLKVADLYFYMGERLELDWFGSLILATKVDNEWQALARDTYLEDLDWQQRTLSVGALRHLGEEGDLECCMRRWEQQEASLLQRWQGMLAELHAAEAPDFAMFAVANRELLDLAQSSARSAG